MNSTDLLTLAASLTTEQVDKMAHALGWPDTLNVHRPRGRVKWANPFRNYYCSAGACPAWSAASVAGLAEVEPGSKSATPGYIYYRVTPLGQRAVRLRLQAVRETKKHAVSP